MKRGQKLSENNLLCLVDWKAIKNISLKLKLYFYKLRQPRQIAVVILINQLASVDQAIQDFKGVALNLGLYPFRKLSSLFSNSLSFLFSFFTIRHYYLKKTPLHFSFSGCSIKIWAPSEYVVFLSHTWEGRA